MGILNTIIGKPLGYILSFFYGLCGNFGVAVMIFTLFVTLLLTPLDIRQQKTLANQSRLAPKLEALKKKCGDDKQKYQQEMAALYEREHVSMTGGCLMMFIRLPILMGVYYAIRNPLSNILRADSGIIESATTALTNLINNGAVTGLSVKNITELDIITHVGLLEADAPGISDICSRLDFNFLGLTLSEKPHFSFDVIHNFSWIWLIPILAAACSLVTMLLSTYVNKRNNPQANSQIVMMLLLGPVFSLIISFSVPGAVGFYWACSNLFGGVIRTVINMIYTPIRINARSSYRLIQKRRREEDALRQKAKAAAAQEN